MANVFQQRWWGNQEVRVHKNDLIEALRKNRMNHILMLAEASDVYYALLEDRLIAIKCYIDVLQETLKTDSTTEIDKSKFHIELEPPVSYVAAYDQIIRMVEMSVDDVFTLTAMQFGCFVMDDWEWKDQWVKTASMLIGAK